MRKSWKKGALYACIAAVIATGTGATGLYISRYGDRNLSAITLANEPVSGELTYTGENIGFTRVDDSGIYDISFDLSGEGYSETLSLQGVDLNLFIPTVPEHIRGDADLVQWFLSEREFNRQRVIFAAGSEHIDAPNGFAGYDSENLVISVTNNCLGAGYWELAVSVVDDDGSTNKIYQGFFSFPLGTYAQMVEELNPGVSYMAQAPSMEPWVGFNFFNGSAFNLDGIRTVVDEQVAEASDRSSSAVLVRNEQEDKANLVVHDGDPWQTYEELRQSDVKFQSFVAPGVYTDTRLWESNFSEISTFDSAIVRNIESPLTDNPLKEVELVLRNSEGVPRRLIVSGIDLEQVPQLSMDDYSEGIYHPMGFGTPFTQDYEELKQLPPNENPFLSVLLDEQDRVINYRMDVGLNGLVMHRDEADPSLLHLYLMSYERIILVGHYVIDTDNLGPIQTSQAAPQLLETDSSGLGS